MTEKVGSTCESCGAPMKPSMTQCELCGWVAGTQDHDLRVKNVEEPTRESAETPALDAVHESSGPFCNQCGWKNPARAQFCSSCGARLQQVERSAPTGASGEKVKKATVPEQVAQAKTEAVRQREDAPEKTAQEAQPLRAGHVIMVLTSGFLIVAALYMVTAFSKRAFPVNPEAPPQPAQTAEAIEEAPLSAELEDQVVALTEEADALAGEERVSRQRAIVDLLVGAQRQDRAAPIQEEIASTTAISTDWFQAGHMYYDWMDRLTDRTRREAVARKAIASYEQGLAIDSTNLDVRTALAMAYLNTQTPMLGIQQIRRVLSEDPDHVQGNFYFGVMLMQSGQVDRAEGQFEKVQQLVDPGSEVYQQAEIMLQNLRSLGQNSSGP